MTPTEFKAIEAELEAKRLSNEAAGVQATRQLGHAVAAAGAGRRSADDTAAAQPATLPTTASKSPRLRRFSAFLGLP